MNNLKRNLIHPPRLLAISFLVAIFIGAGLLSLPMATRSGHISFVNALFTSTSAICVTGLTVVDTATYFSLFGQIVIICLIQLGGLGIMTFSSFILLTAGRRVTLTGKMVVEGSFRPSVISDFRSLVKDVFAFTFGLEAVGAILLLVRFKADFPSGWAAFYSIFHSISAFCNAGFSLFSDNLIAYRSDLAVNLIIMFLIVAGGLGFFVLQEIKLAIRNLIKKERTKFSLHTKLVGLITISIILIGAGLIFLIEANKGFSAMPFKDSLLASFFQVVSARTAGFNTIDLNILSVASVLLLMLIMFIGASPGSTGGGVKTTTFGLIFAFLKSKIQGYEIPRIFSRGIKDEDLIKAFTLVLLAIALIFTATFLFLLVEPELSLKAVLFEVISAFGTVGLSLGITPDLQSLSKLILVVVMYIGRIGPLVILAAFSRVKPIGHFQFVEENIMVG
ncbi:MAG TPA: TrkH family potassium uptake protein [Candidatus Saccharicenans sp.]|nr:TrkH family potassium uptake protein [Candidatus Saccharicenans sp.]